MALCIYEGSREPLPAGDPGTGLALTIAAVPLWFELFQMAVARSRVEDALRYVETDSEQEMLLSLALGYAHRYSASVRDAMEPAFARALEITERIGANTVQTRAGHCGGCGRHAAARAITRPRWKWHADTPKLPSARATPAPSISLTASWD